MEQKFPRKSQAVKTYISTRMKAVDFEKGKIKHKHSPLPRLLDQSELILKIYIIPSRVFINPLREKKRINCEERKGEGTKCRNK